MRSWTVDINILTPPEGEQDITLEVQADTSIEAVHVAMVRLIGHMDTDTDLVHTIMVHVGAP
jgi:hypothetical protein